MQPKTCKVTFRVDLLRMTWNGRMYLPQTKIGISIQERFPLIPWSGLFIGEAPLMIVAQVYYLSSFHLGGEFVPRLRVECASIQDPVILAHGNKKDRMTWSSMEEMEKAVRDSTQMEWNFSEATIPKEDE